MFDGIHNTIARIKTELKKPLVKKTLFIIALSFVSFTIVWYAHASWRARIETRAHGALAELIDRYEAILSVNSEISMRELLSDIEIGCQNNSRSSLFPYFLVCKAHCLFYLNEDDAALAASDKACALLVKQKSNPLTLFYTISLANLMCEKGGELLLSNGLDLLRKCSKDRANSFHEMAIYLHGLYLFKHQSLAAADEIWNLLLNDPFYRNSPWREKAVASRNLA